MGNREMDRSPAHPRGGRFELANDSSLKKRFENCRKLARQVNGLVMLMAPGYFTDMVKGMILLIAILMPGVSGKWFSGT